jgi:hypothetical protein
VSRVSAAARVPGALEQVRALWYDLGRWPSFIDGFGSLVAVGPDWPETGAIVWDSTPHGRGRVVENPDGTFEDAQLTGTQTIAFEPEAGGATVVVRLAFDYRIKERTPVTPLLDLFFVRRAVRDALTRTVNRFAAECRLDDDVRAGRIA